ncbi:hypothetical protein HanPI659440_Chr03g0095811 [Helianthus annuus]|nr:hypothetical protein HanPI659440_Chr03g0095811 [Helianthus annuus]
MRLLYFHHAPVLTGHGPVEGNGSFYWFVFSAASWARPRVRWTRGVFRLCFFSFALGGAVEVRAVHFCSFSCIYARISCLFASFVILSSFHPENTKGKQKHSFSNIST